MEIGDSVNTFIAIVSWVNSRVITDTKQLLASRFGSIYGSPPHFSILLMPFPQDEINELKEDLHRYLKTVRAFSVKYSGLHVHRRERFISLGIDPGQIEEFHVRTLEIAGKYRGNLIRLKDYKRIQEGYYDKEKLERIKKYGYARSGEGFHPHITIGDINTSQDIGGVIKDIKLLLGEDINGTLLVNSFELALLKDRGDQQNDELLFKTEYFLAKDGK